jgi:nicotinate-nucleotide--dimethylbenzimidazole phosphoribosyltransferase
MTDTQPFADAAARVVPVDDAAARAAAEHHLRLTKPPGALGRLEAAGIQLAAIAGQSPPPVPEPAAVAVFAGDHGVLAEGVSPWPVDVTAQMVANFCAGGAAINVLARHAGARVVVVDVGVASDPPPHEALISAKVRAGTGNLAIEPAMSIADATAALDAGAAVAAQLVAEGAAALVTGDMGIGNTTPSAALIAAFTGRPPIDVTGRGTGIDDATLARKVAVIERALARHAATTADPDEPLAILASLGGLEIAALAGFIIGGAAARVPVVVDGVIACAAALVAIALVPDAAGYCVAGHRSTEPGAAAALQHAGLIPLLDLDLRLGEGSGACLAVPVLQAAAKILREMATFDSAGVSSKPV